MLMVFLLMESSACAHRDHFSTFTKQDLFKATYKNHTYLHTYKNPYHIQRCQQSWDQCVMTEKCMGGEVGLVVILTPESVICLSGYQQCK